MQIIAPTIYGVKTMDDEILAADHTVEGGPSILFDAVVIVPSAQGGAQLALQSEAVNFVRDAYGHLKVIGYLPTAAPLLVKAGMSDANPDTDAGLITLAERSDIGAFITAAAAGRVWAREPMVRKLF